MLASTAAASLALIPYIMPQFPSPVLGAQALPLWPLIGKTPTHTQTSTRPRAHTHTHLFPLSLLHASITQLTTLRLLGTDHQADTHTVMLR